MTAELDIRGFEKQAYTLNVKTFARRQSVHKKMKFYIQDLFSKWEKLVQLFNDHYINIVERPCGFKPEKEFDIGSSNKNKVLSSILDKNRNHPSIIKIHKNRNLQSSSISILSSSWGSKITPKEINAILKSLNSKKAAGIHKMPTKLVKLASEILAEPLSVTINNSISTFTFSNNAKIASVVPIAEKNDDK